MLVSSIQTRGSGPLGGQFDHHVEGGGRDLHEFGQVEGDAEHGVDLHQPASLQVLRDALQVAGCGQFAHGFTGIARIAAESLRDGRTLLCHRLGGAGDERAYRGRPSWLRR